MRGIGRNFFFFVACVYIYSTSNLRTFRRTCVHVRKEYSLEISVLGDMASTEEVRLVQGDKMVCWGMCGVQRV